MLTIDLFSESAKGVHAELSWLLYTVMGLFLLTIIVGWLTGSKKGDQAEAAHEASHPAPEQESIADKAPMKAPVKKKILKTK